MKYLWKNGRLLHIVTLINHGKGHQEMYKNISRSVCLGVYIKYVLK